MKKFFNIHFSAINSIKAFTLVELIVGITISMFLMLSVSIFVTDGMKNITNQKVSLESDLEIKEFTKDLYENLDAINKDYAKGTDSGVLFKVNKNYDRGGFSYIGETSLDKHYCASGSDSEQTHHIIIKNFIPFEGQGGDIFAGKSFSAGTITTNMFSGTINSSTGNLYGPTDVAFSGTTGYVSDTLGNSVYSFDKSNISGTISKIAGKEVFGDEFSDGSLGTGVFLNNPTGLSYASIGGNGFLFISDTLNDRILYLNLSNNKIYKLIGREEGLKEPTGIYYDDTEKTLYIANSGKKEILSYSSSGSFVDSVNLNFTPKKDITNVNKLEFSFLFASGANNPTLTSPTSTGNIVFTSSMQNEDFLTGSANKLLYYFSDYSNLVDNNYSCSFDGYFLSGGIDTPLKISGWNGSTGSLYSGNLYKTFTGGVDNQISVKNIGPLANFSNTGAYYIKLDFLSGSTLQQTNYFPYFSKGDDNVFTKGDNIIKVLTGGLGYPTGIYASGSDLVYNDFTKREWVKINKTGNFVLSGSLNDFDFAKLALNNYTDNILYTPIKNYDIKYDDSISKLLNIYFNYYKNFSCYSDENKSNVKEFILKKSLK